MATRIHNVSGGALPLYKPFNRLMGSGDSIVVLRSVDEVLLHFGGSSGIHGVLELDEVPDSDPDAIYLPAQFSSFTIESRLLGLGVTAPVSAMVGLSEVLHFTALPETLHSTTVMPDDWNKTLPMKLILAFMLSAAQQVGDVLDFRINCATPQLGGPADGSLRAATQVDSSFTVVAGREGIGSTYLMEFDMDPNDALNPFNVPLPLGFDFQFRMANLTDVTEVHLKSCALLYNIRS